MYLKIELWMSENRFMDMISKIQYDKDGVYGTLVTVA